MKSDYVADDDLTFSPTRCQVGCYIDVKSCSRDVC